MFLLALGLIIQTQSVASRTGLPVAPSAPTRTVLATRASHAVVLDGSDADDVWRSAQRIDHFRESRPNEDGEPWQRTEARVAYDERNLYVLVRAFDAHPDSIVKRLSRRDDDVTSDWIHLYVDSYHDRRTGFRFSVNPVGVKVDGVLYNDGDEDWAWDGVWEVATRIDSLGWTAEFRIPLSQLRYPTQQENVFGLSIRRWIARCTCEMSWPLYRQSRPGTASQLGELTGLKGLAPPRRFELTPYMVTKNIPVERQSVFNRKQAMTGGADLKYAMSSNFTLTAAVNPDFGQVEADPSVLNLSGFETFFRERRPFFVEGTGLFREPVNCFVVNDCSTGEGLFYSRRIGRSPQLTDWYTVDDAPSSSAIRGAAKVTGRTSRGFSLGVFDALTDKVVGGAGQDTTLEPGTNYAVVRGRQDFRGGESNIGFIATGVNRGLDAWSDSILRRDAYVGGVDFLHRFPGKRYQISGQVNASEVNGTAAAIAATQRNQVHYYQRPDGGLDFDSTRTSLSGYSAEMRFAKFGGEHTNFETGVGRRSPGFEINDLGFLRRADEQNWSTWFAYRWRRPKAFYQSIQWNFNSNNLWTASGMPTERNLNSNVHMQFNSRWWLHTGVTFGALGKDIFCDRCARGGPAMRQDMTISWWGGINGDSRKRIQPSLWANYWRADGGRTLSVNLNPSVDLRFSSRLGAELGLNVTHNRDNTQWLDNIDDPLGITHYVFAHLDQRTASLTVRVDYTMSPTMTLQVYASPFVSKGSYTNLRELVNPRAANYDARFQAPTVSTAGEDPGFNFKQFRSNVVFRWEYRPGSTLFLVWQQGREDDESAEGNRAVAGNLRDLFRLRADNSLLLKASYWLNW